jgi:hypothetical protein
MENPIKQSKKRMTKKWDSPWSCPCGAGADQLRALTYWVHEHMVAPDPTNPKKIIVSMPIDIAESDRIIVHCKCGRVWNKVDREDYSFIPSSLNPG